MKMRLLSAVSLSLCLASVQLSAEPLVEWDFNGGTPGNTFSSDTDNIAGVVASADGFGTTRYGTERTGGTGTSSVEFDSFGYIRVPNHPALNGNGGEDTALQTLQIRAWINPLTEHLGPAQIVRKTDAQGYELFIVADNQVGFGVHGTGGSTTVLSVDENDEPIFAPSLEWSEIIGTWDGVNGTISISVNGVETIIPSSTTLVPRTNNDLGIGALIRVNGTTGQNFLGMIDDFSISGTVTSVEPPPTLVEIARWDMEGTPGATIGAIDGALDDYLGFVAEPENTGEATSLTYVAEPRPGSTGSTAAHFNNPGTNNNNGVLLIVPDHPSLTGHLNDGPGYVAMEVEMWIKPAELGRPQILYRKTDDSEVGFLLTIQQNGTVLARLEEANGTAVSQATTTSLVIGEWYHVRAGFDINKPFGGEEPNFYLHVNDVSRTTTASTVASPLADTVTNLGIGGLVRVGNASKGQYFNGLMDDVIVRAAKVDETSLEPRVTPSTSDWLYAW
jgi:hypothetical protein